MFSRRDYLEYRLTKLKDIKSECKIVSAVIAAVSPGLERHANAQIVGTPCVVPLPKMVIPSTHLHLMSSHMNLIQKNIGVDPWTQGDLIELDWDKLIMESDHVQLKKMINSLFPRRIKSATAYVMFPSDMIGIGAASSGTGFADFFTFQAGMTDLYLLFDKPPVLLDPAGKTICSRDLNRELATYLFGNAKKSLNRTIGDFLEKNRFLTINLTLKNSRDGIDLFHALYEFVNACIKSFRYSCVHKAMWPAIHKDMWPATGIQFLIDAAAINIYAIPDVLAVFDHRAANNGFVLEVILSNDKFQMAVFENPTAIILYRFIFTELQEGVLEADGEPIVYSNTGIAECMDHMNLAMNQSTRREIPCVE